MSDQRAAEGNEQLAGSKLVKGIFFFFIQHVVKAKISLLQEVEIKVQKAARKADGREKKK